MSETPDFAAPPPAEPVEDGAGFDPSRVPDSPYAEWFRNGRDGSGLSDQEYDETIARIESVRDNPELEESDREAARELLRGIRGRE